MRQVGTLANQRDAERFADFLVATGMPSRVDGSADSFSVWVIEENDVGRAKQALAEFQANPADPRYTAAQSLAQHLRQEQVAKQRKAQRNLVDMSQRWNAPLRRRIPLTIGLIGVSVAVTLLTNFGQQGELLNWLSFSDSGMKLTELRHGQLWRLWTSLFPHMSVLHLIFNMLWLYQLGGVIELRRGPLVLLGLVLATEIGADVAQVWEGHPYFFGFSGVVYGLFGYIWIKSRFDPSSGLFIDPTTILIMLAWLLIGPAMIKDIANAAHIGGLIVGMALGYPMRRLMRQ